MICLTERQMTTNATILVTWGLIGGLLLSVLLANAQPTEGQGGRSDLAKATFSGGCFWCMEPPFDELEGVLSTTSGYTGGRKKDPTYEEVSAGTTGHAEAVEVVYDPKKISYSRLLEVFWHNIDPTVKDRQFCDHGDQYRTAIFYHNEEQRRLAEESKKALIDSGRFKEIHTPVDPASTFYAAEDYHQDYYRKNPIRYKFYRFNCGRDGRLQELWGGAKH
jgi:peptide-methionine (S)-S-oxide reductase